jgi:hypothetical protein
LNEFVRPSHPCDIRPSVLALAAASIRPWPTPSAAAPQVEEARTDLEPRSRKRAADISRHPNSAASPRRPRSTWSGQIPGFVISQVSTDRGLGEASQNVLINGQRITGKSNDAQTALSRIAASSVIRLEIADGATLNVSGLNGQVLNVVTRPDSAAGQALPGGRSGGGGSTISGSTARSTCRASSARAISRSGLSNKDGHRGGGWGYEDVRDANGDRLFYPRRTRPGRRETARASPAPIRSKATMAIILNANGALEFYEYRGHADIQPASNPASPDILRRQRVTARMNGISNWGPTMSSALAAGG